MLYTYVLNIAAITVSSRDGMLLFPFPYSADEAADRGGLPETEDHHEVSSTAGEHRGHQDGRHVAQRWWLDHPSFRKTFFK